MYIQYIYSVGLHWLVELAVYLYVTIASTVLKISVYILVHTNCIIHNV